MILSRRVALDGVELDSLDSRILVQGVEPAAGKDQVSAVSLWGGAGARVTNLHRDSLDIQVKFSINDDDPTERLEILERVNRWAAAGGWMTVNYKPDRRIRVIAALFPAEGDLISFGTVFTITFRAYGCPYWQQVNPSLIRVTGASGTRDFGVPGVFDNVMDFFFQNTSGSTVNALTVTCGGKSFVFTSLGLANGETLAIDHLDTGRDFLLRIRIQATNGTYRSAMDKRGALSANDLYVSPGTISVSWSAGGSGTATFSCSGRF